jgi:hypothetical protein
MSAPQVCWGFQDGLESCWRPPAEPGLGPLPVGRTAKGEPVPGRRSRSALGASGTASALRPRMAEPDRTSGVCLGCARRAGFYKWVSPLMRP